MNNETMKLLGNLNEIARRSSSGSINWIQVSPSIFHWDQGGGLIASIQKASESPSRYSQNLIKKATLIGALNATLEESQYLFQVLSKQDKGTVVSLSSRERPELKESLMAIYNYAERSIDSSANNVLGSLLGR